MSVNQELLAYIRQCVSAGLSYEYIRASLLEAGWQLADVDTALGVVFVPAKEEEVMSHVYQQATHSTTQEPQSNKEDMDDLGSWLAPPALMRTIFPGLLLIVVILVLSTMFSYTEIVGMLGDQWWLSLVATTALTAWQIFVLRVMGGWSLKQRSMTWPRVMWFIGVTSLVTFLVGAVLPFGSGLASIILWFVGFHYIFRIGMGMAARLFLYFVVLPAVVILFIAFRFPEILPDMSELAEQQSVEYQEQRQSALDRVIATGECFDASEELHIKQAMLPDFPWPSNAEPVKTVVADRRGVAYQIVYRLQNPDMWWDTYKQYFQQRFPEGVDDPIELPSGLRIISVLDESTQSEVGALYVGYILSIEPNNTLLLQFGDTGAYDAVDIIDRCRY